MVAACHQPENGTSQKILWWIAGISVMLVAGWATHVNSKLSEIDSINPRLTRIETILERIEMLANKGTNGG